MLKTISRNCIFCLPPCHACQAQQALRQMQKEAAEDPDKALAEACEEAEQGGDQSKRGRGRGRGRGRATKEPKNDKKEEDGGGTPAEPPAKRPRKKKEKLPAEPVEAPTDGADQDEKADREHDSKGAASSPKRKLRRGNPSCSGLRVK